MCGFTDRLTSLGRAPYLQHLCHVIQKGSWQAETAADNTHAVHFNDVSVTQPHTNPLELPGCHCTLLLRLGIEVEHNFLCVFCTGKLSSSASYVTLAS